LGSSSTQVLCTKHAIVLRTWVSDYSCMLVQVGQEICQAGLVLCHGLLSCLRFQ
jgi:hypothetical protein